jgi:hypothetical protein
MYIVSNFVMVHHASTMTKFIHITKRKRKLPGPHELSTTTVDSTKLLSTIFGKWSFVFVVVVVV